MKFKFNPMSYWMIFIWVGLIGGLTKLVMIASEHKPEMVTTQYYEKGLSQDSTIKQEQNAQKQQFAVVLENNMPGFGGKAMLGSKPITQAIRIEFYRPSDQKMDTILLLKPDAQGQFLSVFHPAKGEWKLRMSTLAGTDTLLLVQDFIQH